MTNCLINLALCFMVICESSEIYICLFSDSGEGGVFATENKSSGISPISLLLFHRFPFTVFGRIVTININSFQSIFRWTWPHVFIKLREIVFPRVCHSNSPTTIAIKDRIFFIITPILCSRPRAIFDSSCSTMNKSALRNKLTTQTSATGRALTKSFHVNNSACTAVTETEPSSIFTAWEY